MDTRDEGYFAARYSHGVLLTCAINHPGSLLEWQPPLRDRSLGTRRGFLNGGQPRTAKLKATSFVHGRFNGDHFPEITGSGLAIALQQFHYMMVGAIYSRKTQHVDGANVPLRRPRLGMTNLGILRHSVSWCFAISP